MLFDLPFIQPVTPLYFLGDSNSLLYRYLTVDLPDCFPRPIVTNTCFVKALSARTILNGEALNAQMLAFLKNEMAIEWNGAHGWLRYGYSQRAIEHRTWVSSIMPPLHDIYNIDGALGIVVMVGTIDLAFLLAELGANADFRLDDPRFVESAFVSPRSVPTLPFGPVLDLVNRHLVPVGKALAALAAMGFENLYIHSVHPPTVDDVAYFRSREIASSARLRYKLVILINRVLKRLAEENGARFLDMWERTTRDGVIDPRFELDGDHLNRSAVDLTLRAVLNDILAHRGVPMERPL